MADRLKKIPKIILEWWNRFSTKQKTILISVVAGVILAFGILITVLTRPQYELLVTTETTKEASEITALLDDASITYEVSDDGSQIQVLKDQISDANLILGANDIPAAAYDITNVTDGGFSTTESDKQKKYKLYLEGQMEKDLMRFDAVKAADVQLTLPENDGTLIADEEESFASIILELEGEFTQDNALAMAQFVKTALGNETSGNIVIIDVEGNLLYSGEDNYSATGSASSQLSVKQQTESVLQNNVKKVLLGTNEFDFIEVSSNLTLDFSATEKTEHTYTPAADSTQGVLSHEDIHNSESTGGTSGTPGTDSNSDTTYVVQDSQTSSSTVNEESRDYLPNETIINQTIPAGLIQYDQSSISVAAIKYKVLKEEDAKTQGLLDGTTWEEYKIANAARTKITVDTDLINMVAKASGIAAESISVVAYEEPMFIDAEGLNIQTTDVLQIALIIIILALLAFVVIRSMRREKATEPEEELSVETLLQSTPQKELDNIEVETKSETRKLIEKFVDDNPEAAANLLRNWLSEDWG